jgi:peptidoglycan/xylan/chitin deacetylase (PgdA/CDA1 family)
MMKTLLISWYMLSSLFSVLHMQSVNEMGRIPILEYHSIGQEEQRWTRSSENFRKDLEWLYNNDYTLLSIEDYAANRYPVPLGKKPVILTFDDGKNNQFRYLEDGSIDPDCAVGILDAFHEEHPDFGTSAVFYLNRYPFGPTAQAKEKIDYLYQTGRQIGYHTLDHNDLRYISSEAAAGILEKQQEEFRTLSPEGMEFTTLAYPHGWGPKGEKEGLASIVKVGLLVGAEPAYPLYHPKAEPFETPRIQAIDDEWLRHFGRQPGETERQEKPERFEVFVSDGIK